MGNNAQVVQNVKTEFDQQLFGTQKVPKQIKVSHLRNVDNQWMPIILERHNMHKKCQLCFHSFVFFCHLNIFTLCLENDVKTLKCQTTIIFIVISK